MTERRNGGEGGREIYPPPLSYQWKMFDELSESDQAIFRDIVKQTAPNCKPREIIAPLGRIEEQKMVDLIFESALSRLIKKKEDFPLIETRRTGYTIDYQAAVGIMPLVRVDGQQMYYAFVQPEAATEAQYRHARGMYLEEVNNMLNYIGRDKIPPPPLQIIK